MTIYKFTSDMREITGFGGDYEKSCRDMVIAGIEFLEKNKLDPEFSTYKNIYGIIKENNEDAKKLTNAMYKAANYDCTGAMMQTCVSHVLYIKKNGWDKYVEKMKQLKLKEVEND